MEVVKEGMARCDRKWSTDGEWCGVSSELSAVGLDIDQATSRLWIGRNGQLTVQSELARYHTILM